MCATYSLNKMKRKEHLGNIHLDERIILKLT